MKLEKDDPQYKAPFPREDVRQGGGIGGGINKAIEKNKESGSIINPFGKGGQDAWKRADFAKKLHEKVNEGLDAARQRFAESGLEVGQVLFTPSGNRVRITEGTISFKTSYKNGQKVVDQESPMVYTEQLTGPGKGSRGSTYLKILSTTPNVIEGGKGMQTKIKPGQGGEEGSILNPFSTPINKFKSREKEKRGDFATDAPRVLLNPKESGFQSPTKEVDAVQLVNRLKNKVSAAEMEGYEKGGTLDAIRKLGKVSPEKAAEMLQEGGQEVQTHTYGMEGKVSEAKREYDRMTHEWYDSLNQNKKYELGEVMKNAHGHAEALRLQGWDILEIDNFIKWRELRKQVEDEPRDTSPRATSAYDKVSAFSTKEPMPEWTTTKSGENMQVVHIIASSKDGKVLWKADGTHEQLDNSLGWVMIQYKTGPKGEKIAVIVEAQSGWGQGVRELKGNKELSGRTLEGVEGTPDERGGLTRDEYRLKQIDHPLLKDYNRLILKAAIDQARKENATHIVVSDAVTAMMSEGHDAIAGLIKPAKVENLESKIGATRMAEAYGDDWRTGTYAIVNGQSDAAGTYRIDKPEANHTDYIKQGIAEELQGYKKGDTYGKPPQEPGMRLNYDTIIPKIAEELTGGKGEKVTLGEHKNAYEKYKNTNEDQYALINATAEERAAYKQEQVNKPRSNLIFRNPDNTPKTDVSGLMYPLDKVPSQAASLYEKDRPETRGAKVYGGLPIFDPDFWKGTAGVAAEGKIQRFKSSELEKKEATTALGLGAIPQKHVKGKLLGKEFDFQLGLGQLSDPRSYRKTPEEQSLLMHQYMVYKGKQMTALLLESLRKKGNPFPLDKEGQFTLADGSKGFMGDVVEAELRNPGSQKLTKPQMEFVTWWSGQLKETVDMMSAEGMKEFVDSDGTKIQLDPGYFPRPAIGSDTLEAGVNPEQKTRIGSKQFYQKDRKFPLESQGVKAGIKYEPDSYARFGRYLNAVYRNMADHRLAKEDSMQGGAKNKAFESATVYHPAFKGRLFSPEMADKINSYYQSAPNKYMRGFQNVNDFLKAMQFTLDVSAPLNQGLAMLGSNPIRWAKATVLSYESLLNPNTLSRYLGKEENLKAAQEITNNGGSIAYLYDFLQGSQSGKVAHKIAPIRASGRSMGTFLSVAKIELYKAFEPLAEANGWSKSELVESIENMVFSGKMEAIGLSPSRALTERLIFNAPSYMRGAANLTAMAMTPRQGKASKHVARRALLGLASVVLVSAIASYKSEVEDGTMTRKEMMDRLDPRSGKFLRVRVPVGRSKARDTEKLKGEYKPDELTRRELNDYIETSYGNILISAARTLGDTVNIAQGNKELGSGPKNPVIKFGANRKSPMLSLGQSIITGNAPTSSPL